MPSYKIGKRELESLDIPSAPSLTRTRSQTRASAEAAGKEAAAAASVPAPASSGRKRRAEDTEDQRQSKSAKHKATEKEDITYPSGAIDDIDDDDSILEDIGEEVSGAAGEDVATKDAVVEDFAAKDDAAVEEGADMKTDGHSHVVSKAEPAATSSHEARPEPATEPPASLPRHNLTVKQWKRLEKASREKMPRFLFRFFSPRSGGNPLLNTKEGVTPLGFLNGEKQPTSIYDIPKLRDMVDSHLRWCHNVVTEFSSWAADLSWTLDQGGIYMGSGDLTIAIIDTTRLADHVKVYHTRDLKRAGIAERSFSYEYLLYGPISGPAYHCVEWKDLPQQDIRTIRGVGATTDNSEAGNTAIDSSEPAGKHHRLREEDIVAAKNFATCLRRPDDNRPDVIIAITAAALCVQPRWGDSGTIDDADLALLRLHLSDELKQLQLPATDREPGCLVNPKTHKKHHPKLRQTVKLLMAIQDKVRAKDRDRLARVEYIKKKILGHRPKVANEDREADDDEEEADDGEKL